MTYLKNSVKCLFKNDLPWLAKIDKALYLKLIVLFGIALALLATRLFLEPSWALRIARYSSYWFLSLLLVFATVEVVRWVRPKLAKIRESSKLYWIAWALALGGAILWQIHEPKMHKIIFDEHGYQAQASSLHFFREASFPARAHYVDGQFHVLAYGVDKRAPLFPLLVSIIHDFTGFRLSNVFFLNAFLGFCTLLLCFHSLKAIFGVNLGLLGLAFWVSFPLLTQISTSGGYDLLNICLVQVWVWVAWGHLNTRDNNSLTGLVLVTVLLAQVRNESVLFILGTILVVWLRWQITGKPDLSWRAVFLPVWLIIPLSTNIVFSKVPGMKETIPGQDFFSISYMPDNFAHAVAFLFDPDLEGLNILPLSILGALAVLFFLIRFLSPRFTPDLKQRFLFIFGGVIFATFLIFMGTFWGSWTDPIVSRFSIGTHWALLVFFLWTIDIHLKDRKFSLLPSFAVLAWGVSVELPASAGSKVTGNLMPAYAMKFLHSELEKHKPEDILLFSSGYVYAILMNRASMATSYADSAPWKVQAVIDDKRYKEVWVARRFWRDMPSGVWFAEERNGLSDEFITEPVTELLVSNVASYRIERIIGVKDLEAARAKADEIRAKEANDSLALFRKTLELLP